jgi:hypothetical protein
LLFKTNRLYRCKLSWIANVWALSMMNSWASGPQLSCQVFTQGKDHHLFFSTTSQPYLGQPIDFERFRFKAIVSKGDGQMEYIKISVSYRSGPEAIILRRKQHIYRPLSFMATASPGRQQLYSPDYGREFIYDCGLAGIP